MIRGFSIAVDVGDEVICFQLIVRGVTNVEDVRFATGVEAVVEVVQWNLVEVHC